MPDDVLPSASARKRAELDDVPSSLPSLTCDVMGGLSPRFGIGRKMLVGGSRVVDGPKVVGDGNDEVEEDPAGRKQKLNVNKFFPSQISKLR